MTLKYNPFLELEQLFERMSRQFAEASRTWDGDESFGGLLSTDDTMRVDLEDRGDEMLVTVDLPGFERQEVDVSITDRDLHIKAEKEEQVDETGTQYLRQERHHRSLHRSISLPEKVDTDSVTATMKNGVLTVTLPKLEVEQAIEVDIELD